MSAPQKKPENWCAAAMIALFFVPWAQVLGVNGSGYDIAMLGSYAALAWAIPAAAALTVAISLSGKSARPMAIFAGLLPFAGLLYEMYTLRSRLFEVMAIGAYLTLAVGGLMLVSTAGVFGRVSAAKSRAHR